MTELEKLRVVRDFLSNVKHDEISSVTHMRVRRMIDDCEQEELKDRAERAEAALAEAQSRALWFEGLLKAEEARKVGEPVLDKWRVLKTLQMMSCDVNESPLNAMYWIIEDYLTRKSIDTDGSGGAYKWQ